jgi:flagellar hook-length control protein FliK
VQPNPQATPLQQVATPLRAAPQSAAAPAAPPRPGVRLQQAIETVRQTIELGVRQGFSQARIQLAPPQLGSVRIHLQETSDGLVARVVADHSDAAQTLAHGGADLRRSLQAAGVTLVRLDIEASGQRGAQPDGRDPSASGRPPAQPGGSGQDTTDPEATISERSTIALPGGALVDVLA